MEVSGGSPEQVLVFPSQAAQGRGLCLMAGLSQQNHQASRRQEAPLPHCSCADLSYTAPSLWTVAWTMASGNVEMHSSSPSHACWMPICMATRGPGDSRLLPSGKAGVEAREQPRHLTLELDPHSANGQVFNKPPIHSVHSSSLTLSCSASGSTRPSQQCLFCN